MERFLLSLLLVSLSGALGTAAVSLIARMRTLAVSPKWLRAACVVLLVGLLIPVRPVPERNMPVPVVRIVQTNAVPVRSAPLQRASQTASAVESEPALVGTGLMIDPISVLFSLWAAGAIVSIAIPACEHVRFLRMVRRWGEPDGSAEAYLGVRAFRCPFVQAAFCAGILRPMLLLPPEGEPDENILLHELAHIRRKDLWLRALFILARAVHWFNPVLRLLEAELTAACEMRADELVLAGADAELRRDYALAVLHSTYARAAAPLAMQFTGGKKMMKRRIRAILIGNMGRFGAAALAAALLCSLLAPGVVLAERIPASAFDPTVPPLGLANGATTEDIAGAISSGEDDITYGRAENGSVVLLYNASAQYPWPDSNLTCRLEFVVYPEEQTLCSWRFVGEHGRLSEMSAGERGEIDALIETLDGLLSACGTRHVLSGPEEPADAQGCEWLEQHGEIRIWYITDAFDVQLRACMTEQREIAVAVDAGDLSHIALTEQERAEIDSVKYNTFIRAYSEEGAAAAAVIVDLLARELDPAELSPIRCWQSAHGILLAQEGGEALVLRMASMEIVPELVARVSLALACEDETYGEPAVCAKLLEAYLAAADQGFLVLGPVERREIEGWVNAWNDR